jgi:HK97 family phage major capsid protein
MKIAAMLALGAMGLREEFNDNNGGGAALAEKEFQDKVLGGLGETKKTTDELVKNFDNLDSKTKSIFEDITKQKNEFEGLTGQVTAIEHSFKKLSLQLKNEQRLAYGDPVKRILADPDKKCLLNAKIRQALGAPLSEDHQKAITSGSAPGSTYINDSLDTEIYDTLATYGIWNTFDVKTVSTRNNKFLVKTARPTAGFFGEGVTITEDTAKAGTSVTAEAKGIKVVLSVPIELLDDSEVDLSEDILGDFLQAISYRMDWACLQADGTNDSTDGEMTGIFAGGTASVAASGNTTVETLDFEDYTKAMLSVDEGVLSRESRWWMHPRQLVRSLSVKDSNGRPIFLTALEAPTPAGIGSILGSAVVPSYAAPTANSASADIAVFGDPKGLVCGLRKGIEFAQSNEAKFVDYEATFRGVGRFGCKIRDAGAFAVLTTAAS